MMTKDEIYKDIENTLGLVPSFVKLLPDSTLEADWQAFKAVQLEQGAVPNKYKELIGLGIAAATKCRYCTLYHTEVAKMMGATDEEIHEALRYAGNNELWSVIVNGNQLDYDEFKNEIRRIGEFLGTKVEEPVKASV